jgi:hypothetical protein
VTPRWHDDTIMLGYRDLDPAAYEWPEAGVIRSGRARNGIPDAETPREAAVLYDIMVDKAALYKTVYGVAGPPPAAGAVWNGRRVLLGPDLELDKAWRKLVEASVEECGGTVVQ